MADLESHRGHFHPHTYTYIQKQVYTPNGIVSSFFFSSTTVGLGPTHPSPLNRKRKRRMARVIRRNNLALIETNTSKLRLGLINKRLVQTLAYEEVTSLNPRDQKSTPIKSALILHGLLGSARNWRSFSRSLASSLSSSGWRMILVDLRNHGRSAEIKGFDPPHDMNNAAMDLAKLVKSQGWRWPDVVIGHSMGGKVALQFAHSAARGDYGHSLVLPKQVWVLDSVPGLVSPENSRGEVEHVLETLQTLPSQIPSRKWLVDHMMKLGFSKSLCEWLGSNLKKCGDHETWTFNLEGAFQMFNSYRETDYWHLLENPPKGTEISMVRAEKSDRWEPQVIERLEAVANKERDDSRGKFSVHVLPKAGHWVHVDNPKGLLDILAPKIASLS